MDKIYQVGPHQATKYFKAALLSAAYPSWKASRMNPVDALRST